MGACGCLDPKPGGCPACNPNYYSDKMRTALHTLPTLGWSVLPKGCICPPGAEETCKRSDCGRHEPRPALALIPE